MEGKKLDESILSINTTNPQAGNVIDMDKAYQLAGGHGTYQKLATIVASIAFMSNMLYIFSIPFFLADPEIECLNHNGGGWTKCIVCLLYTSPSPRDLSTSRMPSSA
eukprot:TRINITY_DN15828_c0_g1_i1.p3 TRINITY_DN15828_c0_g1~~TRINITY_DN15828_c0_g1_i1.p3  ORF type:complete len:107 (-),score=46.21 TRINITY_DN15828_c0_g1_i1:8-328(-)